MAMLAQQSDIPGISPYVLAVRKALTEAEGRSITTFAIRGLTVELRATGNSIWALIREGKGGLALRAAYLAGTFDCVSHDPPSLAPFRQRRP